MQDGDAKMLGGSIKHGSLIGNVQGDIYVLRIFNKPKQNANIETYINCQHTHIKKCNLTDSDSCIIICTALKKT